MKQIWPFRLLTDAEVMAASERVARAVSDWVAQWRPDLDGPDVEVLRASTVPVEERPAIWRTCSTLDGGAAGFDLSAFRDREPLYAWLFDTTQKRADAALSSEVAKQARRTLARAVGDSLHLQPAEEDQADVATNIWQPWSGWLSVKLRFRDGLFWWMLDGRALFPRANTTAPMRTIGANDVRQLVTNRRVKLQLLVGDATLSAPAMCSLRVGDVVRLDKRIDVPLDVRTENGARICGAFLGRVEDRLAGELLN